MNPDRTIHPDFDEEEELLGDEDPTAFVPDPPVSNPDWKLLIDQLRQRGDGFTRYGNKTELARGGMGVVHRVFDSDIKRSLAMKVIRRRGSPGGGGAAADSEAKVLGRFLEEAQVTGQLEHPGIVPVHELGVDGDGCVYFTMKLVKGMTLNDVFKQVRDGTDESWNQTRAVSVLLRVCEAMAYAHSRGVIHRDLKPGNVMVGEYGETYVMDWGLARILGRKDGKDIRIRPFVEKTLEHPQAIGTPVVTLDGDIVGTPAYMPPEQAEGRLEVIGPRSDIYAVGAMLYHLLAGDMPHVASGEQISPYTLLERVRRGPPDPIRMVAPDVPGELAAIVERAMAENVYDRYATMDDLATDLRAYLENRVVQAYESGPLAELRKWISRNQGITLTALAGLATISVLVFCFVLNLQSKERKSRNLAHQATSERQRADSLLGLAVIRAEEAEEGRRKLLRVSDVKRLNDLLETLDALWPAVPSEVSELEAWLVRARKLLDHRAEHERTLAGLRASGEPMPHPLSLQLAELRADAAAPAERKAELAARIERERDYEFGGDTESKWWHDTLRDLIVGLDRLTRNDPYGRTVASVEARLADARTLEERSIVAYLEDWDAVIEALADRERSAGYSGLQLEVQLGLAPLGRDRDSGLFEFWHVSSGERPLRDEQGELQLEVDSGIVLILVPGGTFLMGAQAGDPDQMRYDAAATPAESTRAGQPVEVQLDPFFLSKFELTQGQWRRLFGENPSFWNPQYRSGWITLLHPVEQISWEESFQAARRLDLRLPSEAQWEFACRAGSDTRWNMGDQAADLALCCNLKDQTYQDRFDNPGQVEPWTDGFPYHAPVGSLRPNLFGFHDMHGNVWEWCLDGYGGYDRPGRPGDGVREPESARDRVSRGGGFDDLSDFVRSSLRFGAVPSGRDGNLGVRLARQVR